VLGQAPFALDALIAQIIKIVAGGQSRGRQAGAQQQAQKDFFMTASLLFCSVRPALTPWGVAQIGMNSSLMFQL